MSGIITNLTDGEKAVLNYEIEDINEYLESIVRGKINKIAKTKLKVLNKTVEELVEMFEAEVVSQPDYKDAKARRIAEEERREADRQAKIQAEADNQARLEAEKEAQRIADEEVKQAQEEARLAEEARIKALEDRIAELEGK